jgi:uncharacterized protein YjiS (DUF1127 family)
MTTVLQMTQLATAGTEGSSPLAQAKVARPIASTATVGRGQGSANAAVFVANSGDVIEAWARQATFASGFGGGTAEDLRALSTRVHQRAVRTTARHAPELARVALRQLRARIAAWWSEQCAVARAHATARELAELDDRQLHDIGLSRGEILSAALENERRIADVAMRVNTQRLA